MKKRLLPLTLLCFLGLVAVACEGLSPSGSSEKSDSSGLPSETSTQPSTQPSTPISVEPSSPSIVPVSHSSSEKTVYTVGISNKEELEEEWYVNDGERRANFECSPGVVRTLIGKEIFLKSSDESIVSVTNNQILTPLKPGKVKLVVTYHDAFASMNLVVKGTHRPVEYTSIETIDKGLADGSISKTDEFDIAGTVTGIYGNTSIIQQGRYAMYVYNKNYADIKVGDRAHLKSTFTLYKGLPETTSASDVKVYEKIDWEEAEYITSEELSSFDGLGTADLSRLVTVDGLYSQGSSLASGGCGQHAQDGVYRCSLVKKGDFSTYVFVNKYLETDVLKAIDAKLDEAESGGMKIKVEGGHLYMNIDYSTNIAVSITSADQLTLTENDQVVKPTKVTLKSSKEKIAIADKVALEAVFEPGNTNKKGLEYVSSNPDVATVDASGVVTAKNIGKTTITATSTAPGCSDIKGSIELEVIAPDFALELKDGGQYYLGLNQEKVGKLIYMTGAMDATSTTYGGTVEAKDSAMLYTAEKTADGKFNFKGSDGKYLSIIKPEGKTFYTCNFSETPLAWSIDADTKALCATYDDAVRFMGTSNSGTYTTIGIIAANKVNANFLVRAYDKDAATPIEPEPEGPVVAAALEAGKSYYLGLNQENAEKLLSLTGEMDPASPTYGGTVEGIENGMLFTAEAVEGGFALKSAAGKYLGIIKPEGKTFYTMNFQDTPLAWNIDADNGGLVATYDGAARMMGTSNTKTYLNISVILQTAASKNFVIKPYINNAVPAEPVPLTALKAGEKVYLGLNQENAEKFLSLTGEMDPASPTYGGTIEGLENGMLFTVEAVEGGFALKTSGGKYLGIVKPEGKTFYTMNFQDTPLAWNIDADTLGLVATYDGAARMMGTSNTKTYLNMSIILQTASAKNFVIKAFASGSQGGDPTPIDPTPEQPVPLTELKDGTKVYLGLNQENAEKFLSLTGAMDPDSPTYGGTIEGLENGMLFTVEAVEGGFALKTTDGKYLGIIKPEGKTFYTMNFQDTPLAWNIDADTLGLVATYDGAARMMGTSNTKTYLNMSIVLQTASAKNFLVKAFASGEEPAPTEPVHLTSLTDGAKVHLGLNQENAEKYLSLTGAMDPASPTYGGTVEGIENGMVFTVEAIEGGFALKTSDGQYLGIIKPEGKTFYTMSYQDTPLAWNIDAETGGLVATYDGAARMMGTSNTKTYLNMSIVLQTAASKNFVIKAYAIEGGVDPTPVEKKLTYSTTTISSQDGRAIVSVVYNFEGYTKAELEALAAYADFQRNPRAVSEGTSWDGGDLGWAYYVVGDINVAKTDNSRIQLGDKITVVVEGSIVKFNIDVTDLPVYDYTTHFNPLGTAPNDLKPGADFAIAKTEPVKADGKLFSIILDPTDGDGIRFWGCLGLYVTEAPVEPAHLTSIKDGDKVYLGLNQENANKYLSLTGEMDPASPTYGGTVEGIENGMVFTVEAIEGGFALKTTDGKYLGIIKPEGKTFYTMNFQDTPLAWNIDAETGGLVATYDGAARMMGTSNTKSYLNISIILQTAANKNFIIKAFPAEGGSDPTPVEKKLTYSTTTISSQGGRAIVSVEYNFQGYTKAELEELAAYADFQRNPRAVSEGTSWDGGDLGWAYYVVGDINVAKTDNSRIQLGDKITVVVEGSIVKFNIDVTDLPVYDYTTHFNPLGTAPNDLKPGADFAIAKTEPVKADGKLFSIILDPTDGDGIRFWGCLGLYITEAPEEPQLTGGTINFSSATAVAERNYTLSAGSDVTNYPVVGLDDADASKAIVVMSDSGTGNNGSFWYVESNGTTQWRVYESGDGDLTFKAKDGYIIVSVKVTYKKENSGVLVFGGETQVASDEVFAVNAQEVKFTVTHTSGTKKGQARVTDVEIVYAPAA